MSTLLIDVGINPDRVRPGRQWLRNMYRVHQRLCMAFPFPDTKANDPEFLKPYRPDAFHNPQPDRGFTSSVVNAGEPNALSNRPVHEPRDDSHNFLFRVDPLPGGRVVILVKSAIQPDWDYAFHNAQHLLAAPPSITGHVRLSFGMDAILRFQLVANPTRKIDTKSDADGRRRNGKRVPVPPTDEALQTWLQQRADANGFRLGNLSLIQPGYVYVNKSSTAGKGHRLRSVRFAGILEINDPQRFSKALIAGIGPAKAFGFGLISVALTGNGTL
ncbi:MAG: type I-E CRISPR-associated protein Cas6/Cse3/CasE [Planctomycetota bacterium]|nr:type I-E CRISPR-associated protein Cas6/Cse3/CasE [Planctomycetota bacterium]